MSDLTTARAAPDPIRYLDAAARTAAGRDYKQRFLDSLDLRDGLAILDIGCGPGTDLLRLAAALGAEGSVIGVDRDPIMVAEARRRLAGHDNVDVRLGDVHELPLEDASVDRTRVDRVLQHLADPGHALAEARRVVRPGGLIGMAEPDWDRFTFFVVTARA